MNKLWNSSCTDEKGRELETFILNNNLNITNINKSKLDYIPQRTSKVDVTLNGDKVKILNWKYLNVESLSDHPYIFYELEIGRPTKLHKEVKIPKLTNLDKDKLRLILEGKLITQNIRWDEIKSSVELDDAVGKLTSVISKSAIESTLPKKQQSKSELEFWNTELEKLREEMRNAREKFDKYLKANNIGRRKRNLENPSPEEEAFFSLKRNYQKLLRKSKDKAFQRFCTIDLNKDLYKGIKKISASQTKSQVPTELIVDGRSITEEEEILEQLSTSFFPSPKDIGPEQKKVIQDFDNYKSSASKHSAPPISKIEIEKSLKSLNSGSSPGIDGISIAIIQESYLILDDVLFKLYNKCLELNYYPKQWKVAKVTVLKKPNKDSYKSVKSFRPISVLNSLGKIFEKILYERLMWLSTEGKWFGENQHGFRPGKSTESAMHSFAHTVETNKKNRVHTAAVFLDISGAFDCTWPAAILAALSKKKCPLYLIEIIASLFMNRTAVIKTDKNSFRCLVPIGCPQGGVLSPFLWVILAEELISILYPFPFKIIGYADDIAIICWHKILEIAISNLQIIANDTVTNCERYLLDINAVKTIFMIFFNKSVETKTIKIKETSIKPSMISKFVGFELDAKLSWKSHIEAKCQATKRQIHLIRGCLRRTWGLDTNKLLTLYKAIIVPKLLYGCSVWSRMLTLKTYNAKLLSVQKMMLKCVTRSYNNVSPYALCVISNLLPINLKALEFSVSHYLSYKQNDFAPSSAVAIGSLLREIQLDVPMDNVRKFFSSKHPPWEMEKLMFNKVDETIPLLPLKENALAIYVKSVKTPTGVSFGLVCCNSDAIIETRKEKLNKLSTENQTELAALLAALEYADAEKNNYARYDIYSNSIAALTDCTTKDRISETAIACRQLCYNNCGVYLNLVNQSEGNQIAQQVAKNETSQNTIRTPQHLWSLSLLKNNIKKATEKMWEKEWANSTLGNHTKKFFQRPSDAICLQRSFIHHQLTQILTGHCCLNKYLYNIKKITSPLCGCGKAEETVEHFLYHCNNYDEERSAFAEACKRHKQQFPLPFKDIPKFRDVWNEFKKFVLRTGRLEIRRNTR